MAARRATSSVNWSALGARMTGPGQRAVFSVSLFLALVDSAQIYQNMVGTMVRVTNSLGVDVSTKSLVTATKL